MNKLIVVGGASGVGKNTLINEIQKKSDIYYYKRRDSFFDYAKEKDIQKQDV